MSKWVAKLEELEKIATASGNSTAEDMLAAALNRFGYERTEQNEAIRIFSAYMHALERMDDLRVKRDTVHVTQPPDGPIDTQ